MEDGTICVRLQGGTSQEQVISYTTEELHALIGEIVQSLPDLYTDKFNARPLFKALALLDEIENITK